ncbi:signal peptidase I [Candidatus Saccharibacteria bacterium]|nr:signal peptidase I [Candidatus Saccharibacteria bacterium]
MKAKEIFKTILGGGVVILAAVLVSLRILGFELFTVMSGSMAPTFQVGDLVYTKPKEEYNVGETITFLADAKTVVTHRVIEVIDETDETGRTLRFYRTQGDANDEADGNLVYSGNVIGEARLRIPYLGFLAQFIQQPPGAYVAVAFCTVMAVIVLTPEKKGERFVYQNNSKKGELWIKRYQKRRL